MAKSYGRKIKRSRNLYKRRKGSTRKFLEIAATVVIVAGLGFVGWNVGKAVHDYFQDADPASTPEEPSPHDVPGEPTENNEPSGDDPEPGEPSSVAGFNAIVAPSSVLDNSTSLAAYIQQAKLNGFNAIVLEMKDSTGHLHFDSEYALLRDTEIVRGTLSAAQIYAAFEGTGVKPVARVNTLSDRLAPGEIDDVSYVFAAGGGRWADDRIENGGKFWANPFLQGTRDYNAFIIRELSNAGFTDIILANTIFPFFRGFDLGVLAPEFTAAATRFEGLVGFVKALSESAGDARLILEMSLKDVVENYAGFSNTAELLRGRRDLPELELLLVYSRDDFGTEYKTGESSSFVLPNDISSLIDVLYKQAVNQTGGFSVTPKLNRENLTDREISEILRTFGDLGVESFIIR
ncbi:MAG: putative glycoside hydrolase [Oscillospiraceae bacterium]|jgi:hypothetical protein|nr:putative glycoside hydrolase [Oscillospiraceae bacterium]